ncbi:MAG: GGDEF domain-containing protein [Pirellulales bacterium]|nr:GGDEF domain-containing protein [Pirellulales bacterium]
MTSLLLLLNLIFLALIVGIGFIGGWCAHWYEAHRQLRRTESDRKLAREVLNDLHTLIDNVSADMDEHNEYLTEFNNGLAVAVTDDTELVATSLTKLLVANSKIREHLNLAENKLKEQSETLEAHAAEARTDSLTRLVNRRAFNDEINRCYAAYQRQGRVFSVILLDLDHFKRWNDTYGHPSGDELLARVAEILQANAREMDLVARYGGEEFAVTLPGTTLADANLVAGRMRAAIEDNLQGDDQETSMTISAGTAEIRNEDTVATLLSRVDAALYQSKAAGRNCVHFHDGTKTQPLTAVVSRDAETGRKEDAEQHVSV